MVIFFYSNEHEPVHVHSRYSGTESKIEIIIENGRVIKLTTKKVPGKQPLPRKQLKEFENLVKKLADEIVQSWINYFIYHKAIVAKKIEGRL